MVLNKRSMEESATKLKNRSYSKYPDGADQQESVENSKKYFVDEAESEKNLRVKSTKNNSGHITRSVASKKAPATISKGGFQHNRSLIHGIAVFFVLYYCAQMYYRYQHRGWIGFADTLWLCNFTIVFGVVAILVDKPYMMGMAVSCTAIVHSLWTVDAIVGLSTGNFPIGNSEYIVWPDITWGEIFTTTHHVWFVPIAIFTLHKNGGYPKRSWLGCTILLLPVVYLSSLFPRTVMLQDGSEFYLNINLVHEWWSDVRGWPFSLIPHEPYHHYMMFFLSFCIVLFVVTHNVMKSISHLLIDKY